MKFELNLINKTVTKDELIDDLKRVAKYLNKNTVSMSEYSTHGKFSTTPFRNRFSGWNDALKSAGLMVGQRHDITEEEVYKNIQEVWIKLGKQPRLREMKEPLSKYSSGAYIRRFGTWNKALKSFMEYINEDVVEQEIKVAEPQVHKEEPLLRRKTTRNISDRLRFRILMRDGFACSKCGRSPMNERGVELHVDHIIPWSKGGETVPENLETKCQECNLGKGNAFQV
jgi:hypothetical protein